MDAANNSATAPDTAFSPRHREVELLAFTLWQERGGPIGTPEIDWFRAEAELNTQGQDGDPSLSALSKKIGSALGSVAALLTPDR